MFDKTISWKENILAVMGEDKWKSRRQIKDALGLDHRTEETRTRALSCYLLRLIKSGHLIRAEAPQLLKQNKFDHVNYVYKRTDKPYTRLYGLSKELYDSRVSYKKEITKATPSKNPIE